MSRVIDAIWRIESPRLIAVIGRMVRDVGLAEELAQGTLVAALEQWPESGIPDNPAAWLTAVAKRRAIDHFRRQERLERKLAELGREWEIRSDGEAEFAAVLGDDIQDDLLRLVFTACHPVLPVPARVALALRLLGGLSTDEIARASLVSESTVAQRIVRAKRTLAERNVQRGLFADRRRRLGASRALRGRASARAGAGRAEVQRAGGPRPGRADGTPGVEVAGTSRPRWRAVLLLIRTVPAGTGCSSAVGSPLSTGRRRSAARRGRTPFRRPSPHVTLGSARPRRPTGYGSPTSTASSPG
jgi:RNA polymerase sigma factor (sigma-70 family)